MEATIKSMKGATEAKVLKQKLNQDHNTKQQM